MSRFLLFIRTRLTQGQTFSLLQSDFIVANHVCNDPPFPNNLTFCSSEGRNFSYRWHGVSEELQQAHGNWKRVLSRGWRNHSQEARITWHLWSSGWCGIHAIKKNKAGEVRAVSLCHACGTSLVHRSTVPTAFAMFSMYWILSRYMTILWGHRFKMEVLFKAHISTMFCHVEINHQSSKNPHSRETWVSLIVVINTWDKHTCSLMSFAHGFG